MRAAIASTFYGNFGIEEDDIFISDGAKCDISRLQVCLVLKNCVPYLLLSVVVLTEQLFSFDISLNLKVVFGSNVTMAVQDPSYPVI